MAERKSVNKYYPPDWDPSKGSVNKHFGQHPLRDRARKLGQGILVIRFELPYNIWCGGCSKPVAMGVRYNAEKSKVGKYYTTPIYKFRMKCHLCDNYFEIQTDPKNHDYVILNGARRKEQRWDPKDNEQIVPEDKATQKKLATDAMYKLEHGSDDKDTGKARVMNLGQIEGHMEQWKDDYLINKLAREKFRAEKKHIKEAQAADDRLLEKSSLDIPLVREEEEDVRLAGLLQYTTTESFDEKQTQKRKEIESKPLFQSPSEKNDVKTATPTDKKVALIKKFAGKITTNKASVFDSPILLSKVEKQNLKLSLGVRRKTSGNPRESTRTVTLEKSGNDNFTNTLPVSDLENMDVVEQGNVNVCDIDRTRQINCDKNNVDLSQSDRLTAGDHSPEGETMDRGSDSPDSLTPSTHGLGLVCAYSDSDNTDGSDDT